jgi:hypothetical protein
MIRKSEMNKKMYFFEKSTVLDIMKQMKHGFQVIFEVSSVLFGNRNPNAPVHPRFRCFCSLFASKIHACRCRFIW